MYVEDRKSKNYLSWVLRLEDESSEDQQQPQRFVWPYEKSC